MWGVSARIQVKIRPAKIREGSERDDSHTGNASYVNNKHQADTNMQAYAHINYMYM